LRNKQTVHITDLKLNSAMNVYSRPQSTKFRRKSFSSLVDETCSRQMVKGTKRRYDFPIIPLLYAQYVGPVAQLVLRLTTGWTVWGSNLGGGEIFRTCPDRLWGPPSLLYNADRVFPGVRKRPGRDADPSPPSSAEV
jgi:hypothetical protein